MGRPGAVGILVTAKPLTLVSVRLKAAIAMNTLHKIFVH